MYYKISLRIIGKYYNNGYIKIEKDQFEGYLSFDYIQGYVIEADSRKFLCAIVICNAFSKLEIKRMDIKFQISEFYMPDTYEAETISCYYEDYEEYPFQTVVQLDFIEKVKKPSDFEISLAKVKEILEL